ncbi:major facilitator superfamily domain-containing protein [Aspergillus parasiticus]|uniref:Major facilitator superfamily domain-containing protein n=1 Tax=Aspergillus parasiticus TaxID=5067 RepID=A0A5N6DJY2_ASPPA|nr:major facilitator superfamily domain-containing protein [Aspergillus parasiticus]
MDEGKITDREVMGEKADITHEEVIQVTQLTPEELAIEKKLRRRIDCLIMPLVILVYLMNYIDRNNYAAAKLQGLMEDLHINDQQYQTGLSILFVGYILMQVPSNLLLNYMGKPSLYLGFFTTAWGLVSALTSQVKSYGGIVACRFILGLVEAPFFAGVLFYLSKWYTKKELALRMSIFYSGSLLSGAFGNLIAAGILNGLQGHRGISAWQWLYIIEGAITMAVGLTVAVLLPDFPDTWKLLSPEMKHVANRRLAIDAAEADVDEAGKMSQVKGLKLAFTDIKTYALALAYMAITGASGFQNFFPTLTKTLGYSRTISLLLVAPPYIFMVAYSLAHSYLSDRFGSRFWFFVYPIPITIVGFVVFMTTDGFGPRYFSFFLMIFVFAQNGTVYSWIANSIPRPPAKRAAAYAFINSIGNSASIWTPYTYRDTDYPYYRPAMGTCIGLQILGLAMAVLMYFHLRSLNKRLDRLEDEEVTLTPKELERLQKTAEIEGINIAAARRLQKGFRYMI